MRTAVLFQRGGGIGNDGVGAENIEHAVFAKFGCNHCFLLFFVVF